MKNEKLSVIIVDYNSIIKTLKYIIKLHFIIKEDFTIHYVIVENYEKPLNISELDILGHDWVIKKKFLHDNNKIYSISNLETKIDILWNGKNNGFAAGNNIGTRYTKMCFQPTFILYSNNDITFCSAFNMKGMSQILREDNSVAAVGPCVVGINGNRQGPAKKTGYVWGLLLHDFIPDKYKKETEFIKNPKRGYVYWVSGCFMLVNADKIYRAGLFDKHTFLYCEEMILAERFLKHHWHFYYDNRVSITHTGGATISKHADSIKQLQMKFSSRLYYYRKYIKINFLQQVLAVIVFHSGLILHICKNNMCKKLSGE